MPQNAGRVGFTLKGAYASNVTYTMLNVVTWTDGNCYAAKTTTTGNAPSNTTYWMKMTSVGAAGVESWNGRSGSVLPIAGDYDATQITYDSNNTVKQKIDSKADATSIAPVGSVISMASQKQGDYTGATTPTGIYPPLSAYLVCDGAEVNTIDYPDLASYFASAYGNTYYFNTGGLNPNNGKFKLPDWSADFPTNGVLCIKFK